MRAGHYHPTTRANRGCLPLAPHGSAERNPGESTAHNLLTGESTVNRVYSRRIRLIWSKDPRAPRFSSPRETLPTSKCPGPRHAARRSGFRLPLSRGKMLRRENTSGPPLPAPRTSCPATQIAPAVHRPGVPRNIPPESPASPGLSVAQVSARSRRELPLSNSARFPFFTFPGRRLRVPRRSQKHNHGRKLHPHHQTDRRRQPSINLTVLHAADINPEQRIHRPPPQRCRRRSGQHLAPAPRHRMRHAIDHRQHDNRQHHGNRGKHLALKSVGQPGPPEFLHRPFPQRESKHREQHHHQKRSQRRQQQQESPELSSQKRMLVLVGMNNLDPFHQQLHHLRSRKQCPTASQQSPVPRMRRAREQKARHHLPASRRQDRVKSLHHVGQRRARVHVAAQDPQHHQQHREKRQKHIERHGLRNHPAPRIHAPHRAPHSFRRRRHIHRRSLYKR